MVSCLLDSSTKVFAIGNEVCNVKTRGLSDILLLCRLWIIVCATDRGVGLSCSARCSSGT